MSIRLDFLKKRKKSIEDIEIEDVVDFFRANKTVEVVDHNTSTGLGLYFDYLKKQISVEIKLLKNNRNWDYDGDQTVGPTGAGRKYNTPLYSKNSAHFSTDFGSSTDKQYALTTNASALKPELFNKFVNVFSRLG